MTSELVRKRFFFIIVKFILNDLILGLKKNEIICYDVICEDILKFRGIRRFANRSIRYWIAFDVVCLLLERKAFTAVCVVCIRVCEKVKSVSKIKIFELFLRP